VLCELSPSSITIYADLAICIRSASPISRMHTRNPFLRHAALQSPTPVVPLSPAAIPLPTPTPDELLDLH
jgi:hypothetical protein